MEKIELAKPAGPYSHAVVVGDLVFVSGQLPIDSNNNLETDFSKAVKQVFNNLSKVLLAYNSNMNNLIKVNIYLTNSNQIDVFNSIYKESLKEPYPARSLVVVNALPKSALLMIDVIAKKVG